MPEAQSVTEALRRIPLFTGLSEQQLAGLAAETVRQRYQRGEIIFSRDDAGDRAFVILSGTVDLVIDSPDGRELILARLQAGEHFGEMALVDDHVRSATARAASATQLVAVLRRTFLRSLQEEPEMSRQVIPRHCFPVSR